MNEAIAGLIIGTFLGTFFVAPAVLIFLKEKL
jgi:hypothetical protein